MTATDRRTPPPLREAAPRRRGLARGKVVAPFRKRGEGAKGDGMRWLGGSVLLILAVLAWLASLLADPYTAWGVAHEQVRPGPARVSANLALASLALVGASAWLVYRSPLNRRGRAARLFAVPLPALAAADLGRAIWIWFVVLA